MPKTPRDFSKGLIYSIVCKTDETLLYVGSTTNFTQRKYEHKTVCNNEKHKDHNTPVYVMIRANGGWDNFVIKPVKEFPCENNIQLVIEEERIRKEMKANLNTYRAYVSPEEYKEQIKEWRKDNAEYVAEYKKKYNQENSAKIAEDKKKYREANTAKIAEYTKKYREANPAKNAESCKKYYEANTAKMSEAKKQWYEANKQQNLERKIKRDQERKNAL